MGKDKKKKQKKATAEKKAAKEINDAEPTPEPETKPEETLPAPTGVPVEFKLTESIALVSGGEKEPIVQPGSEKKNGKYEPGDGFETDSVLLGDHKDGEQTEARSEAEKSVEAATKKASSEAAPPVQAAAKQQDYIDPIAFALNKSIDDTPEVVVRTFCPELAERVGESPDSNYRKAMQDLHIKTILNMFKPSVPQIHVPAAAAKDGSFLLVSSVSVDAPKHAGGPKSHPETALSETDGLEHEMYSAYINALRDLQQEKQEELPPSTDLPAPTEQKQQAESEPTAAEEQKKVEPVPAEANKVEPAPADESRTEPVPAEEKKVEPVPVEDSKKAPVPVDEKEAEPAPVEEQRLASPRTEENKVEPAPIEEKKPEPAPTEENKAEPAAVEHTKTEPPLIEETKVELVPVEEKKTEPATIEEKKDEPAPFEEKKVQPELVEPKKEEPESIQETKAEPESSEANKAEPAPIVEEKEEPALVEEKRAEPTLVEEKSGEPEPIEEKKEELVPVEEKKAEPAPVEDKKEESAPIEEKKVEPAPVDDKKLEPMLVEEKKAEPAPTEEKKVADIPAPVQEKKQANPNTSVDDTQKNEQAHHGVSPMETEDGPKEAKVQETKEVLPSVPPELVAEAQDKGHAMQSEAIESAEKHKDSSAEAEHPVVPAVPVEQSLPELYFHERFKAFGEYREAAEQYNKKRQQTGALEEQEQHKQEVPAIHSEPPITEEKAEEPFVLAEEKAKSMSEKIDVIAALKRQTEEALRPGQPANKDGVEKKESEEKLSHPESGDRKETPAENRESEVKATESVLPVNEQVLHGADAEKVIIDTPATLSKPEPSERTGEPNEAVSERQSGGVLGQPSDQKEKNVEHAQSESERGVAPVAAGSGPVLEEVAKEKAQLHGDEPEAVMQEKEGKSEVAEAKKEAIEQPSDKKEQAGEEETSGAVVRENDNPESAQGEKPLVAPETGGDSPEKKVEQTPLTEIRAENNSKGEPVEDQGSKNAMAVPEKNEELKEQEVGPEAKHGKQRAELGEGPIQFDGKEEPKIEMEKTEEKAVESAKEKRDKGNKGSDELAVEEKKPTAGVADEKQPMEEKEEKHEEEQRPAVVTAGRDNAAGTEENVSEKEAEWGKGSDGNKEENKAEARVEEKKEMEAVGTKPVEEVKGEAGKAVPLEEKGGRAPEEGWAAGVARLLVGENKDNTCDASSAEKPSGAVSGAKEDGSRNETPTVPESRKQRAFTHSRMESDAEKLSQAPRNLFGEGAHNVSETQSVPNFTFAAEGDQHSVESRTSERSLGERMTPSHSATSPAQLLPPELRQSLGSDKQLAPNAKLFASEPRNDLLVSPHHSRWHEKGLEASARKDSARKQPAAGRDSPLDSSVAEQFISASQKIDVEDVRSPDFNVSPKSSPASLAKKGSVEGLNKRYSAHESPHEDSFEQPRRVSPRPRPAIRSEQSSLANDSKSLELLPQGSKPQTDMFRKKAQPHELLVAQRYAEAISSPWAQLSVEQPNNCQITCNAQRHETVFVSQPELIEQINRVFGDELANQSRQLTEFCKSLVQTLGVSAEGSPAEQLARCEQALQAKNVVKGSEDAAELRQASEQRRREQLAQNEASRLVEVKHEKIEELTQSTAPVTPREHSAALEEFVKRPFLKFNADETGLWEVFNCLSAAQKQMQKLGVGPSELVAPVLDELRAIIKKNGGKFDRNVYDALFTDKVDLLKADLQATEKKCEQLQAQLKQLGRDKVSQEEYLKTHSHSAEEVKKLSEERKEKLARVNKLNEKILQENSRLQEFEKAVAGHRRDEAKQKELLEAFRSQQQAIMQLKTQITDLKVSNLKKSREISAEQAKARQLKENSATLGTQKDELGAELKRVEAELQVKKEQLLSPNTSKSAAEGSTPSLSEAGLGELDAENIEDVRRRVEELRKESKSLNEALSRERRESKDAEEKGFRALSAKSSQKPSLAKHSAGRGEEREKPEAAFSAFMLPALVTLLLLAIARLPL